MGRVGAHFHPTVVGFGIPRGVFVPFEAGEIQPVLIDPKPFFIRQELPGIGDGILLEIVAKRPVAEHLEERAVRAVAHFVDVAGAHAFLHVRETLARRVRLAHQIRDERVHACRGKEDSRVVFGDQRSGGDHGVPALPEEAEVELSQLLGSQILHKSYTSFVTGEPAKTAALL